jgi:hypothetical protein
VTKGATIGLRVLNVATPEPPGPPREIEEPPPPTDTDPAPKEIRGAPSGPIETLGATILIPLVSNAMLLADTETLKRLGVSIVKDSCICKVVWPPTSREYELSSIESVTSFISKSYLESPFIFIRPPSTLSIFSPQLNQQ